MPVHYIQSADLYIMYNPQSTLVSVHESKMYKSILCCPPTEVFSY